jgi:hypothetical protein
MAFLSLARGPYCGGVMGMADVGDANLLDAKAKGLRGGL